MERDEFKALFDKHSEEFIQFDRVEKKRSQRTDLHAFLLLDELIPGNDDIVACASHDEIMLETDTTKLAAIITEDQTVELIRCGVRYDSSYDCLAMFV